ncbi:DUF3667 domain-containing protein [Luteimonas panaciterrae]|uniref:DUF3667 domain-containing protein n=1 Tax=Luteimonas panaciterrae TaxID=363885 RepID=UPI001CFBF125|nr:DUF3667 domain-containing protein [Luteimonas panaciterrae]
MTEHAATADASAHAACEHCATPLQGHFCHRCGQSAHNPLKHLGHAIEELFESFWHLDGRIFSTLRGLLVPGRVAAEYLAGHRVCFIPPLRLFLILSVLTFFVGKLTVHIDEGLNVNASTPGNAAILRAGSVAEVERVRTRLLAEISDAETQAAAVPGIGAALNDARLQIQDDAARRIAELEGKPLPAPTNRSTAKAPATAWFDRPWSFNDKPWDATSNPVTVTGWPDFANRWLNNKIGRAKANISRMGSQPDLFVQAFMSAVPTALFVLIPVFALLLRLLYLYSGRSYLEHLVVALYSHAYLLLVLLAAFLLSALGSAFATSWVGSLAGYCRVALWLWAPIYLLLMQRRVYGDGWLLLLLRYAVIAFIYTGLVVFASVYAALAGLTS